MPRTRCSRASSSTLGSAPRIAGRSLRVGRAGVGSLRVGAACIGATRVGGGFAHGVRVGGFGGFGGRGLSLGRTVLSRTVLSRTVLGGTAPGRLGGLTRGLALLGRGLEALLLVRTRFG